MRAAPVRAGPRAAARMRGRVDRGRAGRRWRDSGICASARRLLTAALGRCVPPRARVRRTAGRRGAGERAPVRARVGRARVGRDGTFRAWGLALACTLRGGRGCPRRHEQLAAGSGDAPRGAEGERPARRRRPRRGRIRSAAGGGSVRRSAAGAAASVASVAASSAPSRSPNGSSRCNGGSSARASTAGTCSSARTNTAGTCSPTSTSGSAASAAGSRGLARPAHSSRDAAPPVLLATVEHPIVCHRRASRKPSREASAN